MNDPEEKLRQAIEDKLGRGETCTVCIQPFEVDESGSIQLKISLDPGQSPANPAATSLVVLRLLHDISVAYQEANGAGFKMWVE